MKATLALSIAATLALLLFCVVVTVNSPRSLAGEALGIDLPRPIETQWSDDHGGFLGDGVTRGVLAFSSQNGAALEKRWRKTKPGIPCPCRSRCSSLFTAGKKTG